MNRVLRRRAEEIFHQVVDLSATDRAVFLDQHCVDESELRAEVASLLKHSDHETIVSLKGAACVSSTSPDLAGQCIGPYKLLQLIGEGGFGAVYMAEQEQPVRRRVALKIIKLGMDTRQVIARFEAERQALAMMEHPNIARVLDAGATDTGRPYFVMELVRGIPITDYCDRNSLPTNERLELFMQVCRAMQHAHQKGIIHRDIKPSNVLVTLHDGTPVPKVIDFGIAKATSQRLTEKTLFTEFMQFIGTPQYMSPEQAEMSGLDVDTRTDLYSLGVLLYELLTGTTPFDAQTMRAAAYTEIQRIIREEDPPTPSRRLSTLGDQLTEVARSRRAEPQVLSRLIRGDLDWIVMKALEKDRSRRYETAAALVADIQHHLNNEPVMAGPPGAAYRVRKFIRRHRIGVTAVAFVVAAVLIGLALATLGFIQASYERDRALIAEWQAQNQADKARAEAQAAKAINVFFNDMLTSVDPMQVRLLSAYAPDERVGTLSVGGFPRNVSVAEMVRQAAAQLDQAFAGKPELEAASRETLGMTLRGLGFYVDAEPQLRRAYEIRREKLKQQHPDTLRSALALGDLLLDAGKGSEAEPLIQTALEGMSKVYGPEDTRTLSCASILATVLSDQGKYKKADEVFQQTLEAQKRILDSEHRDTLVTMWRWSTACLSQWRLKQGQALARELNEIAARTLSPDDSLNILSQPLMGWWYLAQYDYARAEAVLRPGLEQCRRILGPEHPVTYMTMHCLARTMQGAQLQDQKEKLHREALAGLRATRGRLHWHTISTTADFARWLDQRGNFAEAEQLFRALMADCARSLGDGHSETLHSMAELAEFLERIGKIDESVALRHERLAIIKQSADTDVYLQGEVDMLAHALVRMGRIDEARDLMRGMLKQLRKVSEAKDSSARALNNYAWALLTCAPGDLQDPQTALPIAEQAVKLSNSTDPAILDTLAYVFNRTGRSADAVKIQRQSLKILPLSYRGELIYSANLIRYLLKQGDTAGADQALQEGVRMFRQAMGENNPLLAMEFSKAGVELASGGHYRLAEPLLLEAVQLNRKILGDKHAQVANALMKWAHVCHVQGKYALAEPAYREALDIHRKLRGEYDVVVANTLYSLGVTLYERGDLVAATDTLRQVLQIYEKLDARTVPLAIKTQHCLAWILIEQGEYTQADSLARQALTQTRKLFGDRHPDTVRAMTTRAYLLVVKGQADQAEPMLRKCVAAYKLLCLTTDESQIAAQTTSILGQCLTCLGQYEQAEPLLLASFQTIQAAKGNQCIETHNALQRIIALYESWNQPEKVTQWRQVATRAAKPQP
ncbi:MAG: tetratricopeptide repeat protein [Planctomycetota bacterium]